MADARFYRREGPFRVADLAAHIGLDGIDDTLELTDIASLDEAMPDQLSFFSNPKMADKLAACKAGAVLIKPEHAALCPANVLAIICPDPYRAMALTTQLFYPDTALARPAAFGRQDDEQNSQQNSRAVHPDAIIGEGVIIEPYAVIGPKAEIGAGSYIGAGAYIGHGTIIGRNCTIGANASVSYSLLGDGVIVHGGAQIGVDGFGFAPGEAHVKIPQLGRVILQDSVEIGANCGIDRGALGDTIIGEGSKLDNLNHIAHNVRVGRHCFITASCAIAGSTTLGDYVQMGGGAKITGHVTIGDNCVISAMSAVLRSFPANAKIAGSPARLRSELYRDQAFISRQRKAGEQKR